MSHLSFTHKKTAQMRGVETSSMDDDRVLVCVSDFYAKCMRMDAGILDANCMMVTRGKTIAGSDAVLQYIANFQKAQLACKFRTKECRRNRSKAAWVVVVDYVYVPKEDSEVVRGTDVILLKKIDDVRICGIFRR